MLYIVCFHSCVHIYLLILKTLTVVIWHYCITTLKSDILIAEKISNLNRELYIIFYPSQKLVPVLIILISTYKTSDDLIPLNDDNG